MTDTTETRGCAADDVERRRRVESRAAGGSVAARRSASTGSGLCAAWPPDRVAQEAA